ncbi:MAG: hypothetical protein KJ645_10285 [Planctomycetes bacterium]|nr:hypothetical protein [Planctomycetota bacterium]
MMNDGHSIRHSGTIEVLKIIVLSACLSLIIFWLQGDIVKNVIADEGFLWYGTWRTTLGEVPMRDFQSYEPGRYYWGAAWSWFFGSGILPLRKTLMLFQIGGLAFGLLVLKRVIHSWILLIFSGLLLLVWMLPIHKIFEHSIAMAAVYFATLLLERPSIYRHFIAGTFVGLASFFGRNHGLYCFVSYISLILLIRIKVNQNRFLKKITAWGMGIIAGYSPMLFMILWIPGFYDGFLKCITITFRLKSTNIPLPIPWPWTADFASDDIFIVMRQVSLGVFFLAVPVCYLVIGTFLVWSKRSFIKRNAALIGSVFVGAAYMHHSFSRADFNHLAQGIHPFLLTVLMLPFLLKNNRVKRLGLVLLILVYSLSFFSAAMENSSFKKAVSSDSAYLKIAVQGDDIWVRSKTAHLIQSIMKIDKDKVLPGEGILLAPCLPGLYPLLQRVSPLWDVYFLFEEIESRQEEMVSELSEKNVNWLILNEQRLQDTHPLLCQHFMNEFESIPNQDLPPSFVLFRRKQGSR